MNGTCSSSGGAAVVGDRDLGSGSMEMLVMLPWAMSLVLLLVWWVVLHRLRQREFVGPKTWPLIGCIVEQATNFDKLHDWLLFYFKRTLTFSVPMATINNTFTASPANVEYILKTNFSNYPKGEKLCGRFEDLMGQGIFTVDGEMWMHQRKVATAEFASSKLREYSIHTFRDKALQLVKVLELAAAQSPKPVDLQDLFMRLTLDSICTVGFGVGIGCLSQELPFIPFASAFDEAMRLIIRRYVDVFWQVKRAMNTGSERRLAECLEVVNNFLYDVINRRREEMKRSSEGRADLLSRFMVLEGEEAYTDKMLRDVVMNFMVAGRDTTALTLSWFFSELCKHPEVVAKINDEVSLVLHNKHQQQMPFREISEPVQETYGLSQETLDFAKLLDYQTLNKMHYLHAALTEALRLYPAVPLDTKQVVEDDTLPDGTKVRAGQFVSYVPYSMARLEAVWGPDAQEFKPERWLNSNGVYQPQSPYKFTTFQAGPRMCLGKDSAYLQMKMTTVLLLKFFSFSLVEGQSLDYRMMAVLYIADGVKAIVTRR